MNQENINPIEEIKKIKPLVWETIQKFLPKKEPLRHYQALQEYPKRQGKYLRPGLVMLACQMFEGKQEDALLTAGAMQVSEDWLLIHDDIEDHSEERRSTAQEYRPALQIIYGDEIALNAGDGLHVIMWKIIGQAVRQLKNERGWKVYDKFNQILLTVTEGQFIELDWIRQNKINLDLKEYFKMVDRKTGCYTTLGPLQLGAIVAGKDENELKKIQEWSIYFGRAFQIWDDCMNLTVASEKQGKEIAGDILEGKRSLPLIHLFNNATQIEKDYLQTIFSRARKERTEKEKNHVLNLMEKYKSIEYAQKTARFFADKAEKIFDKNTEHLPNSKEKQILRSLFQFVVNRDR